MLSATEHKTINRVMEVVENSFISPILTSKLLSMNWQQKRFHSSRLLAPLLLVLSGLFIFHSQEIAAQTINTPVSESPPQKSQQWYYLAPKNRPIYDKFYQQIQQQLNSKNIIRLELNANIDCSQKNTLKFFISAGVTALKKLKNCANNSTIFGFYLTQQQFYFLSKDTDNAFKKANIFYVDQPLIRQLALSHYFLPKTNKLSVMYNSSIQQQINQLQNAAPKFFILKTYIIKNQQDLLPQLANSTANSDFILATIDNKTYNSRNAKSILLSSYRKRVPLFGGTRGFVKAGVVASCISVPDKLIFELIEFIKDTPNAQANRQYPLHFEISHNTAVSRSFNLNTTDPEKIKRAVKKILDLWGDQK